MPDIDVSDVLIDPEIAGDTFTVLRRQETMTVRGKSTVVVTAFDNQVGAVWPSSDNELKRLADYDAQHKAITVVTAFRLRGVSNAGGQSFKPDIVQWGGSNFEVADLKDWSRFGAGMIEAICVETDFVGQAPA